MSVASVKHREVVVGITRITRDRNGGSMNGAMMDMLTTMSKVLVMGVPLNDVVRQ